MRTWGINRDHSNAGKLWPLEYLSSGLSLDSQNPRILLVKYDSKRLEREHFLFNIPDNDIGQLSSTIARYSYNITLLSFSDLRNAGVGKRPLVIVAYSMGGVVARQLILSQFNS